VQPTRRVFLKAGTGAVVASVLGFDVKTAYAQAQELKIAKTTETRSTCPYCSVSCGVIIHTIGDKAKNVTAQVVHVEGDPDHPINRGTLCPKGANTYQLVHNPHRVNHVMYRAPFSLKWERRPLDWAMKRIADLVKETRDRDFVERDKTGLVVNHVTTIAHLGGATLDNEENYLIKKLFSAGLGILPIENQARI